MEQAIRYGIYQKQQEECEYCFQSFSRDCLGKWEAFFLQTEIPILSVKKWN